MEETDHGWGRSRGEVSVEPNLCPSLPLLRSMSLGWPPLPTITLNSQSSEILVLNPEPVSHTLKQSRQLNNYRFTKLES